MYYTERDIVPGSLLVHLEGELGSGDTGLGSSGRSCTAVGKLGRWRPGVGVDIATQIDNSWSRVLQAVGLAV